MARLSSFAACCLCLAMMSGAAMAARDLRWAPSSGPSSNAYGQAMDDCYSPSPVTTYSTPSPYQAQAYPSPPKPTYPTPSPVATYSTPSPVATYSTPSPVATYPTPSPVAAYPTPSPAAAYPSPVASYPSPVYSGPRYPVCSLPAPYVTSNLRLSSSSNGYLTACVDLFAKQPTDQVQAFDLAALQLVVNDKCYNAVDSVTFAGKSFKPTLTTYPVEKNIGVKIAQADGSVLTKFADVPKCGKGVEVCITLRYPCANKDSLYDIATYFAAGNYGYPAGACATTPLFNNPTPVCSYPTATPTYSNPTPYNPNAYTTQYPASSPSHY